MESATRSAGLVVSGEGTDMVTLAGSVAVAGGARGANWRVVEFSGWRGFNLT